MNRNPDKPLCCFRLYQKVSEDLGLSKRYISRIVKMLNAMNIVNSQERKRIRYKKQEDKYGFIIAPKVFVNYRHCIKDKKENQIIDTTYDYKSEIQKTARDFRF